jgi:predicted phosphoribosyltransferase
MTDFQDVNAGAKAVAAKLPDRTPKVVLAVMPNGSPVATAIAESRGCKIRPLFFDRATGEVKVDLQDLNSNDEIWVADDGVESGTAATAIGDFLKQSGFTSTHLVVPVCARDAIAQLQFRYTTVIAAVSPLMSRSLKWHYAELPNLDLATAQALISTHS